MTTITVTAEHIARGEREDCKRCPVALAILDALPGARNVWIGGAGLLMTLGGADINIDLPDEVNAFIRAFDAGRPVKPFTFTVEVAG